MYKNISLEVEDTEWLMELLENTAPNNTDETYQIESLYQKLRTIREEFWNED
jgi:hypothetical protein